MSFKTGILAGVVFVAGSVGVSSLAADTSPPVFTPTPSSGWFSYTREWISPASGPGPVQPDPSHAHVTNDEYRISGKQPTFPMGDPNSPILQPWAREVVKKRNDRIQAGRPAYSLHSSCYPVGIPYFVLLPMTRPMYIVQGPKEVVMILESFNDVRRIYLTDKHTPNLKPRGTASRLAITKATRSSSTQSG